jgi:hypothetical protein
MHSGTAMSGRLTIPAQVPMILWSARAASPYRAVLPSKYSKETLSAARDFLLFAAIGTSMKIAGNIDLPA